MDDLEARSVFLFGTETPPEDLDELYPADDDDPDPAGALEIGQPWRLLRRGVAESILADAVPELWSTAKRMLADGLSQNETLDQLCKAMFFEIARQLEAHRRDHASDGADRASIKLLAGLAATLPTLPLPDDEDVVAALMARTAAQNGIGIDALVDQAVATLGRGEADDLARRHVRYLLNRELDDGNRLAGIAGARVVNRIALGSSAVLTHRLTPAEVEDGVLTLVSSDLCLFANAGSLVLADGAEIDVIDTADGLGWAGPEGWLAAFNAGELIAVRVDVGAGDAGWPVTIESLGAADIDVDDDFVAAMRGAFDELVATEAMAMPLGAVLAGAAIDHPHRLESLQAPVVEICRRAGLEVRRAHVGDRPEHWDGLVRAERHDRLHEQLDDGDLVHDVLDALDVLEGADADDDELRDVLRTIGRDADLAERVIDELVPFEPDPYADDVAGRLSNLARRLVGVARHGHLAGVARWVAAVVDERAGDVLAAEPHLRAGAADAPDFAPVVDRCAWYASDRGDAATALRLWSTLDDARAAEVATVRPFVRRRAADVRRNDPCWCGSGRKYKACHQREPHVLPLPERVGWLCRKATAFIMRQGFDARAAIVGNVIALADGSTEDERFEAAVGDPLAVDAALTEGGWFARFLDARGPLLPAEEQMLAASWLLVERTVYEVELVDLGHSIDVRDLRTGDRLTVSADRLTREVREGSLICGRAVPDGAGHQLVGGVFPVLPGQEAVVLEVCDCGDPLELCAYVGATRALTSARPVP